MIDIHTHLGQWGIEPEPEVTEEELLRQMDALGIEKAVILPMGMTPESFMFGCDTKDAIAVYRRHPDRFIPFCNLDPRTHNSPDADFSYVFEMWKEQGCKGLGELTANLPADDPLCLNLYRQCGEHGLPIIFHVAEAVRYGLYGLADEIGLPRLEKVIQQFPQTNFLCHSPTFWVEVSAEVDPELRSRYPTGPVTAPGRAVELISRYPNCYGDLSAHSGFNAISRDPEFGFRFLEECQDKLLFGTDICHVHQEAPLAPYLREALAAGKITETCFRKVTRENAERLLGV